jgi:hypothetical protein
LLPRHRRKRAGIDDAHEEIQCRESVHLTLQTLLTGPGCRE